MAIQEHKRMDKSIIIIGGGLTGLSAGCYGRMNGYRTTIFEMHSLAGGVATAWKRKGYTIDGAMNWLMGTNPQSSLYRIWEELGAAPGWKVHNHEVNAIFENREGRAFTVYCDADRFEEYLLELAPEDAAVIQELTRMIRSLDIDFPAGKPGELQTIFDKLAMIKMLPVGRLMRRLRNVTANSFARRFRNPFVREMFGEALGSSFPLAMALMQLAIQHRKAAGYVIGGALALVEPIQKRYRSLGGELRFNARVQKILVENDRAVGVRLADGTEHWADWVVSTADGRTTIFDMLEGRYLDDALKRRYENPRLFAPLVYVALGVNRKLDVVPSIGGTAYPLDRPLVVAGKENRILNLRVYNFDPTLSPPGKDVAVVQYETDYDYWSKLRQDPQAYQVEKERICDEVIGGLEQRFPGVRGQIEMRDVATPVTWERYTGNWRGAYEGWMFDESSFTRGMKKTLPGLEGFYMAGQWVNPGGGMPTAAVSGNHTIQLICRKDRKRFIAAKP
jgi:phytoene dehydrogenase-like protein